VPPTVTATPVRASEPTRGGWADRASGFLLVWFALAVGLLALVGAIGTVLYLALFVGGFGLPAWFLRDRVRPALARSGRGGIAGFVLLAVAVTTLEELLVAAVGGRLALEPLWADLLVVNATWFAWMLTWYLVLAPRYVFSEREALLLGGTAGVYFEVLVSRIFLGGIVVLVWVPVAWVVYAAVFLWPLQLIDRTGTSTGPWRIPMAVLLPIAVATVVALPLEWALATFR
jgi:hypothetical protein